MPDAAPTTSAPPLPLPAREMQFEDLDQQTEAAHLGMWLFLSTEILFFGGLFGAYTVYRISYPAAFAAASKDLLWWAGAGDTAILLVSSFVMALAVHSAKTGGRKMLAVLLLAAAGFGALFLCLHGFEYYQDFVGHHVPGRGFRYEGGEAPANQVQLFFLLYFVMTGLHSLHVTIGVLILAVLAVQAWRGKFSSEYHNPVEVGGLYWHFVDIVWVFLFPLLYLIARR